MDIQWVAQHRAAGSREGKAGAAACEPLAARATDTPRRFFVNSVHRSTVNQAFLRQQDDTTPETLVTTQSEWTSTTRKTKRKRKTALAASQLTTNPLTLRRCDKDVEEDPGGISCTRRSVRRDRDSETPLKKHEEEKGTTCNPTDLLPAPFQEHPSTPKKMSFTPQHQPPTNPQNSPPAAADTRGGPPPADPNTRSTPYIGHDPPPPPIDPYPTGALNSPRLATPRDPPPPLPTYTRPARSDERLPGIAMLNAPLPMPKPAAVVPFPFAGGVGVGVGGGGGVGGGAYSGRVVEYLGCLREDFAFLEGRLEEVTRDRNELQAHYTKVGECLSWGKGEECAAAAYAYMKNSSPFDRPPPHPVPPNGVLPQQRTPPPKRHKQQIPGYHHSAAAAPQRTHSQGPPIIPPPIDHPNLTHSIPSHEALPPVPGNERAALSNRGSGRLKAPRSALEKTRQGEGPGSQTTM
ncbi:hypothetical protein BDK51DRAFT_37129 [Blyttiomyces helicus]|uniref:Uncharacterized protein n=1 Tax=Blyttiomyces helicus TaxID=388810 RepID=A0A4P9WF05_9FUNG|nr:hypothetical protein BDK51DRAFT_37129 [Blyttiomyces helicus]|eukprot:RKO90982.1 hypothetical protein BDK51DRAFT_37129 [Blyttiomyces helicus]